MASNAKSLLLRLPQEIKDHIYVLICGGGLFHVELDSSVSNPNFPFCQTQCLSKTTEEDAQASFDASKSPWFDEVNANRHEDCCSPKIFCDVSGRNIRRLTLDLRFLRTCRQIYNEAKIFYYTANTFSFDEWHVFSRFLKTVSWVSYIRSIHLQFLNGANGDGPSMEDTLRDISSKLTGLRRIYIDLDLVYMCRTRRYSQDFDEARELTEQLLCFAGTALKAAAVVISDARFCHYGNPETKTTQSLRDDARSQELGRWTMAQKQEYSQFLRNAILQHRGKRVHIEGDGGMSRPTRIWWDARVY